MEGMDTITPRPRPMWIAGHAEQGADTRPVTHPYDATEIATVAVPDAAMTRRAVDAAARFAGETRSWAARDRARALERIADEVTAHADELAEMITAESGVPLRHATAETADAAADLRAGARFAGETRSAGHLAVDDGALALARRVAPGAVVSVVPPHRPLGHAAHVVAAAFAVAAPVLLVPSPHAPLSALGLGELLAEQDLPDGAFSVLPVTETDAAALTAPGLVRAPAVDSGTRATVVLGDWPDFGAAARAAADGLGASGPFGAIAHTAVVERSVADDLLPALTEAVRSRPVGDPYDTAVAVGPLVDEDTARRVVAWVDDAVAAGAARLAGGTRSGRTVEPTLLDVTGLGPLPPPPASAPVLTVSVAESTDEALATPAARLGLFTRDVGLASRAVLDAAARQVVVAGPPAHRPEAVGTTMRRITEERLTILPTADDPAGLPDTR